MTSWEKSTRALNRSWGKLNAQRFEPTGAFKPVAAKCVNQRFVCAASTKGKRLLRMTLDRVVDAKRALTVRIGKTNEPSAQTGQPADFLAQFQHQHACVFLSGADSRAQARQAAADNDDVGVRSKRIKMRN